MGLRLLGTIQKEAYVFAPLSGEPVGLSDPLR